jgi:hypothetical protein
MDLHVAQERPWRRSSSARRAVSHSAEDFTFTVPVELASLPPEITYGTVFRGLLIRSRGARSVPRGTSGAGFASSEAPIVRR